MTDPTPAEAPAEPRLIELSTLAEQTEAIDTLIELARQHIRVFDQDLSQTGWGSAAGDWISSCMTHDICRALVRTC
jgi:hypothetical protein